MATADIDGFRINIDDTLAGDIKKVDKALEGISKTSFLAANGIGAFANAVNSIDAQTIDKVGSLKKALEDIKTAITGLPSKNLTNLAKGFKDIKNEIADIDETKLSRAFSSAKTPSESLVGQITKAVNELAQLSEGVRSMMTQASKPLTFKVKDEKTDVETTKQTNEQHSLEQINATLKQREQEMQRLVELQNALTQAEAQQLAIEEKIRASKSMTDESKELTSISDINRALAEKQSETRRITEAQRLYLIALKEEEEAQTKINQLKSQIDTARNANTDLKYAKEELRWKEELYGSLDKMLTAKEDQKRAENEYAQLKAKHDSEELSRMQKLETEIGKYEGELQRLKNMFIQYDPTSFVRNYTNQDWEYAIKRAISEQKALYEKEQRRSGQSWDEWDKANVGLFSDSLKYDLEKIQKEKSELQKTIKEFKKTASSDNYGDNSWLRQSDFDLSLLKAKESVLKKLIQEYEALDTAEQKAANAKEFASSGTKHKDELIEVRNRIELLEKEAAAEEVLKQKEEALAEAKRKLLGAQLDKELFSDRLGKDNGEARLAALREETDELRKQEVDIRKKEDAEKQLNKQLEQGKTVTQQAQQAFDKAGGEKRLTELKAETAELEKQKILAAQGGTTDSSLIEKKKELQDLIVLQEKYIDARNKADYSENKVSGLESQIKRSTDQINEFKAAVEQLKKDKERATQIGDGAGLSEVIQQIKRYEGYIQETQASVKKLNEDLDKERGILRSLDEAYNQAKNTYSQAGGDIRLSELKQKTAELEKQKNLQKQTETKGTPTSGVVDVSVKFNEQALTAEITNISNKLKTIFENIPVSLKKELDLTFFEQKAKELKKMFEGITVPAPQSTGHSKTEGIAPQPAPSASLDKSTVELLSGVLQSLREDLGKITQAISTMNTESKSTFSSMQTQINETVTAVKTLLEQLTKVDEQIAKTPKANADQTKKVAEQQKMSHQELQEMYDKLFKAKSFNLPLLEEGSMRSQFAALERIFGSFQSEFMRIKDFDLSLIPKKNRDEINSYIEQINQLGRAIHQIGALDIPINQKTVQIAPILAEIEQLRSKISSITSPFAQKNADDVARISSKMNELGSVLDGIAMKIHSVVSANEKMQSSALAIDAQREKIKGLETEWERLVLTQQHLNADGSYTEKAKQLVSAIEDEKKKLSELTTKYSDVSRAKAEAAKIDAEQDKAFAKMVAEAQAWYNKDAANREKVERKKLADLEKMHDEYYKNLAKMEATAEKRRADIQQQWNDRRYQNYISSAGYAEQFGQRAIRTGTYEDTTKGIKLLQNAMAKAKPNSDEWNRMNAIYQQLKQNADKYRQSLEGIKNQSLNLMPTLNNLAMQLGIVFSVQQITQWIKHMTEVRAQFELQQIALRSIIQDKQKADEVFAQIQQLALKSPFSIMQLNTYTKQIAAYGVEADKLVGTTKELADVSAGLGVDMGRLILAYGQVKTANYLRATEVRQFTEAGLNITQELANYFTELKGKMVTAGEVTEMITKRMVKFEDVAEVFHRVTSAGGMFYNMQEKQAEGLAGQMQRIGDAYSMMLNDIGKSNQSIIVKVLATIRELIQNWRTLAPIIEATVVAFAGFYTAKGILGLIPLLKNVWAGFSLVVAEMRAATGALATLRAGFVATNTLIGTMGWVGLALAIGSAVYAITQASKSVSQLEEDLDRMRREIIVDVADSVGRFKELADVIKDPTASFEKQKDALDELRRAYGDILPSEMLEIENIKKMGGSYIQATEAIREYYRVKLQEEQKSRVEADAVSMFGSASKNVVEDVVKNLEKYGASKSTVQNIMNGIIEQAKSGAIKGAGEIAKAFQTALEKYYNIKFTKFLDTSDFDLLAGAVTAYQNELASLDTTVIKYKTHEEKLEHQVMQQTSKAFDVQKEKVENLTSALKELYNLRVRQDRVVEQGGVLSSTDNIQMATAIASVNKAYAELGDTTKRTDAQIMSLVQSTYNLDTEISRVTHSIYGSFIKGLSDTKDKADALAKNKYLQTWVQGLQREIDAVDGTPVQKEIRKIEKSLSDLYNVDLGTFDWLTTDVRTSFSSAAKEVKGKIDEIKEQVLQFKTIASMSIFADPTKHAEEVTGMSKEEYDRASKTIEMYTKLWNALGGHDKEKKTKGTDKTEQTLRERIQLLKEANQTYEKYAKEYDKVIAKEKTHDDLMERAKELKIADIFKAEDLTNTATLDAMQKVYDRFKSLYENKKYVGAKRDAMKAMSEKKFDIAVELNKANREELQRELDKMMGGYQLYVELDKTGVDANIAKQLFDIDYTSLDDIQTRWEQLYLEKINEDYKQMQEGFEGFKTYEEAKQKLSQEKDNENYKLALDTEKKITDAIEKEYQSRMKEYIKYLKKSYGDAVNTQVEAYHKMRGMMEASDMEISLIQKDDKMSPEQKTKMIEAIRSQSQRIAEAMREEMQKSLNEIQWKEFKENPIFSEMFGDLDKVGKKTIETLLSKIQELKSALSDVGSDASLKIIKEMTQYEEKLFAAKVEKNPFSEYIKALKEIRSLNSAGLNYNNLNNLLAQQEIDLTGIEAQIQEHEFILSLKEQQNDETVKNMQLTDEQTKLLSKSSTVLNNELSNLKKLKTEKEGQIRLTQEDLDVYKKALTAQEAAKKKWQQYGEIASQVLGAVRAGFEAFEHDADAKAVIEPYLDGFEQIMNSVVQMGIMFVALGVTINSALGIIGIIATAVSALMTAFSAFNKAHDAELENQIKADQRAVDKLQRAFDNLSEAIDNAFSGSQLGVATKESIKNLKEQNKYYSDMINAEREKKDSDNDKIIGWQNQIEDNIKQMKELQEQYINELGGIATGADVLSAAQDFVDAWIDAFEETGDGLSGLQDNWDAFMKNILKKQAYMKVADHWIDNFGDMINKAFDENGEIDYEKIDDAMKYFTDIAMPQIDSFLTDFNAATQAWGGISDSAEAKLSGLTAGIQGVTEETAQIVEAMLNSIRYFVSDTNSQIRNLFQTLTNPPSENAFLMELKAQTAQLTALNKTLGSLVKAGHKNGGYGLKVFA